MARKDLKGERRRMGDSCQRSWRDARCEHEEGIEKNDQRIDDRHLKRKERWRRKERRKERERETPVAAAKQINPQVTKIEIL